jgi:hypothetical protein
MPRSTNWLKAIQAVLERASQPLAATEIADAIADQNLIQDRTALPVARVAREISASIEKYRDRSPFVWQSPTTFGLRSWGIPPTWFDTGFEPAQSYLRLQRELTGFINAFGMFWERNDVHWSVRPRLLGQQPGGTKSVDFCNQSGVYLLHDQQGIVYVGRASEGNLGDRLKAHTKDRHRGRWSRFSWFGVFPVQEIGVLENEPELSHLTVKDLCTAMEALLIESIEPRQNWKRGDRLSGIEFLQVRDPRLPSTQL